MPWAWFMTYSYLFGDGICIIECCFQLSGSIFLGKIVLSDHVTLMDYIGRVYADFCKPNMIRKYSPLKKKLLSH